MADKTDRTLLVLAALAFAAVVGLVIFGVIDYTTRFM